MKKIILFLILLMPLMAYSQSGYYNKIFIKDSIYSTTGIANFSDYYKDGVPFSSGGGDVYLGNRQTFSARNVFNDTLLSNAYAEFDNIKLTNYINFLGDIISDIGFIKGANVSINTRDNYSLRLGANNDSAMLIDKNNKVTFIDTVKFDRAAILDSIFAKNYNITNAGGAIQWLNGGQSSIFQISNNLYFKQNSFEFVTSNNSSILTIDSLNGLQLDNGVYNGDGSGLTNLDANSLTSGTLNAARLPELVVTKTGYISTAGAFVYVLHGIPDWRKVTSFTFNVLHDSTGTIKRFFYGGYNISTPNSTGFVAFVDTLNFAYYCPVTATGLVGDSVFFRAIYRP